MKCSIPTYSTPKSSTMRQNWMGCHLWCQRPRGGLHLVVTLNKKAGSEEIIGEDASLGQTITTLANFEVDPTIVVRTCKLVFFHEFSRDIRDFDADVLRVGHWGIEVEVLEVNGAEVHTFAREHIVEQRLKSSREAVLVPTSPGKQM